MKKQKFLLGAAGLLALGLTACSNEMPVDNNQVSDSDQVRYLRVAISNPPATRADAEFENGIDSENAVAGLNFKFYDALGNPISSEVTVTDKTFTDYEPANSSIGKVKEVIVQVSIAKAANFPSYVMCFVNPVNYSTAGMDGTMESLRNQTRSGYRDNATNFAMTNSVYYGEDIISGADRVKISGTPIPADCLYTSKAAAEAADAKFVDIYVERYAAKVRLNLNRSAYDEGTDTGIKPVTTENGYTLTFIPEAWSINADEPSTYVVKRYQDDDATTTTLATYDQVQDMLGNWTDWNDPTNHRSYWACSPSFYAKEFPQVSDNIIDQATTGTGAGELVGNYKLRYYSYNQIKGTTGTGAGVTYFNSADGNNWKYVLENTMNSDAFKSLNPKAAAPSVLIVGNYDVSYNGTTVNATDGFCLFGGELYYQGETVPTGAAENQKTILDRLLDENQTLAINENGTLLNSQNVTPTIKAYFNVVHPNKDVRGTQVVPHRYVTLQLKDNLTAITGLWYKPVGSSVWVPVAQTTDEDGEATQTMEDLINSVNNLLWAQIGSASAYTQNKCYYSIPIQHLGITENKIDPPFVVKQETNEEGETVDVVTTEIDWKKVRVGDFGIVRNHVYTIDVTTIQGRATGIENLSNPLVPSMDENDYWVKYKINILNWRVVPDQSVKL
ncbi:MAG: fimbria major subunit [Muribaculaceae bacterium]|nr:fimbria major subunit [Muribaculaceae bacterium]